MAFRTIFDTLIILYTGGLQGVYRDITGGLHS